MTTQSPYSLERRAALLKEAESIVTRVKATGQHAVSGADQARVTDLLAEVDKIDEHRKKAADADALMARLCSHTAPDGAGFDSPDMPGVKEGLARAVASKSTFGYNLPIKSGRDLALKSFSTTTSADGSSVARIGDTAQAGGAGGVSLAPDAATSTPLRDLFPVTTTANGVERYYKFSVGRGADVVAEGGIKPELDTSVTPVTEALQKIAVRFQFTDELAQDAAFLVNYLQQLAARAVLARENKLILDLLDAQTEALTSTGTEDKAVDVLAGAIAAAQATNGLNPGTIVANPVDVAKIRMVKAAGSGEYAIDPMAAAAPTIHGVPLASTAAATPGTIYLLSPGFGHFYQHATGLRVEVGATGDDFITNQMTCRVEERVLPVVLQPTLITRVKLTTA